MRANNSKEGHFEYNDFKRARYFDGEILNKQIFEAEQSYHQEKRKLLNRMLHGWGVVCGLKVKATNPPSSNIIVEPGLALDCQGNEIYVCEEQTVDLSVKPCIQKTKPDTCSDSPNVTPDEKPLYVVIKYQESPSDRVPSYAPSGNCEEKTCDYSRTREGFCIEVRDELPDTPKPTSTNMLCSEPFKCPTCYCCPDPHYIVLATIRCGKRIDEIFFNGEDNEGETSSHIRNYHIKRTLDKVCISKVDENVIHVTDIFNFRVKNTLDFNNFVWTIKPSKFPGIIIDPNLKSENNTLEYTITVNSNASTGTANIEIPIHLKLKYDKKIIEELDLTGLNSLIEIGTLEPKRGNIISNPMIRNMENRHFAVTFPLLSWFLNSRERIEGQIFSGNFDSICGLMMSEKELKEENIKETVIKIVTEFLESKKTVVTTGSRYGSHNR